MGSRPQKMGEKCFGALALPAESKKHDLLRETKCAPTSWGRNEFKRFGWIRWKSWEKVAEMGRFFASEWLREPGAQQMLVNKATPFLKKGIDQLSTAIRPKKNYKTNRKDLDGAGIFSSALYGFNYAPWTLPKRGKGVDIHKAIGRLPKPKKRMDSSWA